MPSQTFHPLPKRRRWPVVLLAVLLLADWWYDLPRLLPAPVFTRKWQDALANSLPTCARLGAGTYTWDTSTGSISVRVRQLRDRYGLPFWLIASTQTFTSSGTWMAVASTVEAQCWGAGGNGSAGTSTHGGAGGGGGGYAIKNADSVTIGNSYTVTVGIGGATGTGGDSWFDSTSVVLAKGSISSSTQVGDAPSPFTGGSGGAGGVTGHSTGGGGGSSAGTAANGTSGTSSAGGGAGGIAPTGGGNGGNAGTSGLAGAAGSFPGGGAGGGGENANGGAGAGGQVILTWTTTNPLTPTVLSSIPAILKGWFRGDPAWDYSPSGGTFLPP